METERLWLVLGLPLWLLLLAVQWLLDTAGFTVDVLDLLEPREWGQMVRTARSNDAC